MSIYANKLQKIWIIFFFVLWWRSSIISIIGIIGIIYIFFNVQGFIWQNCDNNRHICGNNRQICGTTFSTSSLLLTVQIFCYFHIFCIDKVFIPLYIFYLFNYLCFLIKIQIFDKSIWYIYIFYIKIYDYCRYIYIYIYIYIYTYFVYYILYIFT